MLFLDVLLLVFLCVFLVCTELFLPLYGLEQKLIHILLMSICPTKPNAKFMADLLAIFTLFSVYLHSLLSLNMESGMFY